MFFPDALLNRLFKLHLIVLRRRITQIMPQTNDLATELLIEHVLRILMCEIF